MESFRDLPKVVLFNETALTFICYLANKSMRALLGNTESHETDCLEVIEVLLSPSRPTAGSVPYSRHCFLLHLFQQIGQSTNHPSLDDINSSPSLN